jgi:hypothetical protein
MPFHQNFVLYGGTGLALQLGHRGSEDFDFFSSSNFDPDRLRSCLPFLRNLDPTDSDTWVQRKPDNLEAFVNRGGLVKLAFFGGLDTLQRVEDPPGAIGSRVQVAALVDLAGMKMGVVQSGPTGRTMWTFTPSCLTESMCLAGKRLCLPLWGGERYSLWIGVATKRRATLNE